MTVRPRVFVTQPITPGALQRLQALAVVKMNPDSSAIIAKPDLIAAIRDCDVLFTLMHDTIDRDVIAANPDLSAITSMAVSPTSIDIPEATRRGIPVTIAPPLVTEVTADMCFALLLAVARRVVEADQLLRSGVFPGGQANHVLGAGVWEKTIGLIGGGGRIGAAVARRARGFDMRVLYWSPRRKSEEFERDAGMTFVPLDDLLRQSDFVSLHSPIRPETLHQISARELDLMKPTAFLINTARGKVVDEAALVSALERRRIAGAALDVFEHEPSVSPVLKQMKNVVLTPHLGTAVFDVRDALAHAVIDNLAALIEGRRPPNIANPEVLERGWSLAKRLAGAAATAHNAVS